MTLPPPPDMPGSPGMTPPGPGAAAPPSAPPKSKTPLVIGVIAGVVALCLLGTCVVAAAALVISKRATSGSQNSVATGPTLIPTRTSTPAGLGEDPDFPPEDDDSTSEPTPPPPPAKNGQCIVVSEDGDFLGIGNCNGSRGTYRVVSVDYSQGECADPESPYITVDGYRLCLELHLVRFYCYKFPKGDGWVVGAPKCKAKGTVHIIDIVPGASNDAQCTRDYQWNRWYRFTHPTVVYCVMQY
ncbi:hypothetical protein [Micromonospora sp. HM5-17]|uniref:hypothetical protein n=1 Tax=Micromonospora sp. HM5-17 TaxID=2487710 RepID=UPI0011CE0DA6|nr:hypothetical protein [Micromonospora sp. HM5-17]